MRIATAIFVALFAVAFVSPAAECAEKQCIGHIDVKVKRKDVPPYGYAYDYNIKAYVRDYPPPQRAILTYDLVVYYNNGSTVQTLTHSLTTPVFSGNSADDVLLFPSTPFIHTRFELQNVHCRDASDPGVKVQGGGGSSSVKQSFFDTTGRQGGTTQTAVPPRAKNSARQDVKSSFGMATQTPDSKSQGKSSGGSGTSVSYSSKHSEPDEDLAQMGEGEDFGQPMKERRCLQQGFACPPGSMCRQPSIIVKGECPPGYY